MSEINKEKHGPGRTTNESRNTQRPPRVKLGQGQTLVAPERKGYQRYWALDREGQLDAMIAAWWEFVLDADGNKITRPGKGGWTHYLMEIDQETYDKDMAEQQDMVTDAVRQAVKVGEGEYVPDGKEDVLTRDKL